MSSSISISLSVSYKMLSSASKNYVINILEQVQHILHFHEKILPMHTYTTTHNLVFK